MKKNDFKTAFDEKIMASDCRKCSDNSDGCICTGENGDFCNSCLAGYYFVASEKTCVSCSVKINKCVTCSSDTTCTKCSSNAVSGFYTLSDGKCI